MRKKRAFTLIELLVVISVVALLMAVLLPALSRVKNQAKAVACLMHLKQWRAIFTMYTNNHDGRMPISQYEYYVAGKKADWPESLRSYYMEEPKIRLCPATTKFKNPDALSVSEAGLRPMPGEPGWQTTAWGIVGNPARITELRPGDYASYGMNKWCHYIEKAALPGGKKPKDMWKTMIVRGAANIPLFLDSTWKGGWPFDTDAKPDPDGDPTRAFGNMGAKFHINRHNMAINILFMDSAVKKVPLAELWNLKWSRSFDPGTTSAFGGGG